MSLRFVGGIAAVAWLVAAGCQGDGHARGDDEGDRSSEELAAAAEDAGAPADADRIDAAPRPSYADRPEGLRELLDDILAAGRRGDRAAAFELADSLRLDDPYAAFGRLFGAELGDALAEDYAETAERIRELVPLLFELGGDGVEVVVEAYDQPSERTTGYQARALERMREPTPLYSARFVRVDEGSSFHLWSFIHDGESFRWAGKMRQVAPDDVPIELLLDLPEGAEIPLDGGVPDLLELPGSADVRPSE